MHTRTHEISITMFLWHFGIVRAAQAFFLCFRRLTKPTTFVPAVITKHSSLKTSLG